jgi:hypothetical protein
MASLLGLLFPAAEFFPSQEVELTNNKDGWMDWTVD